MTGQNVLDCPMDPNGDAGVSSVREYLLKLLSEIWRLEEGFDSKRPFGNSGWQYEVYTALVHEGLIEGGFDEWDDVELNERDADQLIFAAILALGDPS